MRKARVPKKHEHVWVAWFGIEEWGSRCDCGVYLGRPQKVEPSMFGFPRVINLLTGDGSYGNMTS